MDYHKIKPVFLVTVLLAGLLTAGSVTAAAASSNLSVSGSATSTSPGSTVTVSFTVNNTGDSSAFGPALRITNLPSNWNVTSHSDAGATYQAGEQSWLWLSIGAETTKTPALTLKVPAKASAGTYNISAELLNGSSVVVDTTTIQVTVTQQLRLTMAHQSGMVGDKIRATLTLMNKGTSQISAPAVRITSLPSEWSVVSQSGAGGTWKPSTMTWTWLSIPGNSTLTPSVTLQVPSTASPGTYNVSAVAILNGHTVDHASAELTIQENIENNYDQNGNGEVDQISELQSAISDWATNESLSLAELQMLIQEWATAGPV